MRKAAKISRFLFAFRHYSTISIFMTIVQPVYSPRKHELTLGKSSLREVGLGLSIDGFDSVLLEVTNGIRTALPLITSHA